MSTTERMIPALPERVWAVLADPHCYPRWVVGADSVRTADPAWPAAGSRFDHRVGWGPLKVHDYTQVLAVDAPRRLVLRAKARPLGTARVDLTLAPREGGTFVTMVEEAGDRLTALVFNRLTDPLVHGRNEESLRRLEELAVSGAPAA